ncbi:hypothetical protein BgiBS90_016059 [Biomphalaria glabrata]|nr:hypothetical protein BgiBS90_016059 [Biomphalaria glabrata]
MTTFHATHPELGCPTTKVRNIIFGQRLALVPRYFTFWEHAKMDHQNKGWFVNETKSEEGFVSSYATAECSRPEELQNLGRWHRHCNDLLRKAVQV